MPPQLPCMCGTLRRAVRAVTRIYDEELRDSGLKNGQFGLLLALSRSGPVGQGEIGEMLVLDHTTLSRTLRPMVKAGTVAVRAGEDRRERIVELTARGRRLLEKATPAWERAQARLRAALGESQWKALGAAAQAATDAALEG